MKEYSYIKEALASKDANCIEQSFEKFYLDNYNIVCREIVRYVNNVEDAEELANDMFLNLFNKMYVLLTKPNMEAYLKKRAKFTAINYIKSVEYREKHKYILMNDIVDSVKDEERSENYRTIISDLKDELDPIKYKILEERLLYNTSFIAISKKLNMSINTVKSNYRRTIEKLKERMDKNDF